MSHSKMLSTLHHHPQRSLSRFLPSNTKPYSFHTKPIFSFSSSQPITQQPPTSATSPPESQILSIRHSLLSRQVTATQLAETYLSRLKLTEPQLKSFIHLSNNVLKEAQAIDEKIRKNENVGPLAGVLVGVKDNMCTVDMPSTAGSRVLENYCPPFDATAVRKVKELGGIVVGKTNLDEFGMGSTTEASAFQVLVPFFFLIID